MGVFEVYICFVDLMMSTEHLYIGRTHKHCVDAIGNCLWEDANCTFAL
jgi:hypothetical protein